MATTTTLKTIIEQVLEETEYGTYLVPSASSTTSATLTTAGISDLRGPFTGKRIPIGSPVLVTNTGSAPTGVGEDTFVSDWNPTSGVLTFSPALSTAPTAIAILYADAEINHFDRINRCIKRVTDNRMLRWQRTPLTFVPDGDLRGTTITDSWPTAVTTATTLTYVTPTFPSTAADQTAGLIGPVNLQRVLNAVTTNATNQVQGTDIFVPLNSTVTGYQWYFQTAIRMLTGTTDTVTMSWRDVTNNAAITLQPIAASDTFTFVTSGRGWINMEGTFNIPTGCTRIAPRFVCSATASTYQVAPIVAYPTSAVSFPIPNRIISESYIGNFHYATQTVGVSGPFSQAYSEPITTMGQTHTLENFGDHYTVTFNFRPLRPVYFDELTYDEPLVAMTDTTTFPLDYVTKWTLAEIDILLYELETRRKAGEDSTQKAQNLSRRIKIANASINRASYSDYEPELMKVYGRA